MESQAFHMVLVSHVLRDKIKTITIVGKAMMIKEVPGIPVLLN